ncbi:hypothetical protein F8B47_18765, partial [Salmonella enterica subsp. enterica serovar Schwarzengrund]
MSPRLSINCRIVTLASSATSIPFTGLISKNPPAYTDGFYEEVKLTDKPLFFWVSRRGQSFILPPCKSKNPPAYTDGFLHEEMKLTDKPLSFGYSVV